MASYHSLATRARIISPKKALALALFIVSFAVYVRCLPPSITWEHSGTDSGDLVTAAYILGVAHPPGYPTFALLGKLFTLLIPFGEIAYRVNLMSAFFAALAVVLVYLTALEILPLFGKKLSEKTSLGAAAIASLALAFSPVFWPQATIAEVHALNAFFVAVLCYLLMRWWSGGPTWLLLAAAFLLGLGAGNHLTLLLIAPGALYLVLQRRHRLGLKSLVDMALLFILGLSIYLYLPLRATAPSLNWDDPATLQGFINVVFASPYRRYLFTLPLEYLPQRLSAWASLTGQQFNWLGLALGILGAAVLWERQRRLAVFTFTLFALAALYAIMYNTVDSYIYLIPAFLILALWLGGGVLALATTFQERFPGHSRAGVPALLALLFLLLPGLSFILNYSSQDLSRDSAARDYAAEVFDIIEPNALIVADTDQHILSLWYYRNVLRESSGVTIVAQPLLTYDAYVQGLLRRDPSLALGSGDYAARLFGLVKGNLGRRPVYLTEPEPIILKGFPTRKSGPLYRVEG